MDLGICGSLREGTQAEQSKKIPAHHRKTLPDLPGGALFRGAASEPDARGMLSFEDDGRLALFGMRRSGSMNQDMRPGDDRVMVPAAETARRNPLRPPDHLPRDRRSALSLFWRQPSPWLIAAFALGCGIWRLQLGPLGWKDAAVALAVLAYFPFNEWLIHVYLLHYKPRRWFGRSIDFHLPRTHRRHHAEPWNLRWVFIPLQVHALTPPVIALLLWALWPWKELVLSFETAYLLLGLHYEWVHYLAHIPWCPDLAHYRKRVREHRYHHFRNENFWWRVSMGSGDRWFRTAPAVDGIGRSGTTATLGLAADAAADKRQPDGELRRHRPL
jgi:hypothetical protein